MNGSRLEVTGVLCMTYPITVENPAWTWQLLDGCWQLVDTFTSVDACLAENRTNWSTQ